MSYVNEATSHGDGTIRDVWDGEKVKQLREQGWFQDRNDLGLILSTDGGALFRRTGVQAWPIWAINANLPPSERYVVDVHLPNKAINYDKNNK